MFQRRRRIPKLMISVVYFYSQLTVPSVWILSHQQIRLIELQHKNEDWLFLFSHSKVNFCFSIFNTREEDVFIRPRLTKPEMILL